MGFFIWFYLLTMKALGPSIGLRLRYRVRSTKEKPGPNLFSESWDVIEEGEILSLLSSENDTFCRALSTNRKIERL